MPLLPFSAQVRESLEKLAHFLHSHQVTGSRGWMLQLLQYEPIWSHDAPEICISSKIFPEILRDYILNCHAYCSDMEYRNGHIHDNNIMSCQEYAAQKEWLSGGRDTWRARAWYVKALYVESVIHEGEGMIRKGIMRGGRDTWRNRLWYTGNMASGRAQSSSIEQEVVQPTVAPRDKCIEILYCSSRKLTTPKPYTLLLLLST